MSRLLLPMLPPKLLANWNKFIVILAVVRYDDFRNERYPAAFLIDGLQVLKEAGYASIIRNSGGLGVINDAGILNVSLIFLNIWLPLRMQPMK